MLHLWVTVSNSDIFCHKFVDFNHVTLVWRQFSEKSLRIQIICVDLQGAANKSNPLICFGLNTIVSEEVANEIAGNCCRRQPHCPLTPPPRGTPANICVVTTIPYISRKCSHWPAFLSAIVWVYANLFCNRMGIDRSRSSKVDDICANRKRVCDLLLFCLSNLAHILQCFWDTFITATYWLKISYLPTLSHSEWS